MTSGLGGQLTFSSVLGGGLLVKYVAINPKNEELPVKKGVFLVF